MHAYATLHRQVEQSLPPLEEFTDPAEGLAAIATLRETLVAARLSAREGQVFGSAAAMLRRETRQALRRAGVEPGDLLAEMRADTTADARPPAINDAFPWAVGHLMPACVIQALPALPGELGDRLAGTDLVLIDIDANLVIDILRDALAPPTR